MGSSFSLCWSGLSVCVKCDWMNKRCQQVGFFSAHPKKVQQAANWLALHFGALRVAETAVSHVLSTLCYARIKNSFAHMQLIHWLDGSKTEYSGTQTFHKSSLSLRFLYMFSRKHKSSNIPVWFVKSVVRKSHNHSLPKILTPGIIFVRPGTCPATETFLF